MATEHFSPEQLTERFTFDSRFRNIAFGLIGIGLVLVLAGVFFSGQGGDDHGAAEHASVVAESLAHPVADTDDHGHGHGHGGHATVGTRVLANLLISSMYFFTICMGAFFFLTIHRVGNAGWQTAIKRVPEAIISYLPVGVVGFGALFFFLGHLYAWADPELAIGDDPLIDVKRAYLNNGFFIIRNLIYFGIWGAVAWYLRKLSIEQDSSSDGLSQFSRSGVISTVFIILFAISYCLFAVDWVKSLEPHWFSTIFGIYIFGGSMKTAMVVIFLLLVFLQSQGYMKFVNNSHFHDVGKYAFGFTVFWAYIWVAQYLLIWYSNIPEEGIYYVKRYRTEDHAYLGYAFFFYSNIVINFIIPFLALMTRNAKRAAVSFVPVGILMLYGHWHDLYLMVMPGAMGYNPGIGLIEVGMFVGFAGVFIFTVLTALTKANLVPLKHPYLEESLHHSTGPV